MKKKRFIFLLILIPLSINAQFIKGTITDATSKEPLPSVNIYFSGTSKGTITDFNGDFKISYYENSQSIFTVSLLGYETQIFSDPLNTDFSNLELQPKVGELPAVYLYPDPWSREKKEKYFIKQFLGTTLIAKECSILNLDKVRMRFNPSTKKMTAYAEEPLLIENRDLNYLVTYNLTDFEITFEELSLENVEMSGSMEFPTHYMISSYFVGSAFFKELNEKDAKRGWVRRHRKRAYKVSELRLFKLIAENRFDEEGYHLVFDRKKVVVKDHIRSRKKGALYIVDFREKQYEIMDPQNFQSAIYLDTPKLVISDAGNVLNYKVLKTGGFVSNLKVSGMLPLDYKME
uniref:carboxypeptidase-like regulatory domain-containing protein n=1 Tax=Nonlabens sp. Ci31 TaxID=2608253 RepID=UPI001475D934|nr:carboxypeptidase-like regulatory domain-containing protein [Nonlabens sp. Ci31]